MLLITNLDMLNDFKRFFYWKGCCIIRVIMWGCFCLSVMADITKIMHGPFFFCSSVFVSVCVFNVWPKTALLLRLWPRDAQSLDTPALTVPTRLATRGAAGRGSTSRAHPLTLSPSCLLCLHNLFPESMQPNWLTSPASGIFFLIKGWGSIT